MNNRPENNEEAFEINSIGAIQVNGECSDALLVRRAAARRDCVRKETESALADVLARTTHGAADVVEREADIARLRSRLAGLTAALGNPAFGRLDLVDGTRVYVGRTAITADDKTPVVVDWRAPVARSFYTATAARPFDVRLRRHLVVRDDRLVAHDDEWLQLDGDAAVDPSGQERGTQRVAQPGRHLLDALSAPRTGRMKDVATTLQAEQDAIIRADRRGTLVVQGAPGTGKTVVALHRVAYLLYENRERYARSGVLLVGPTRHFLQYVSEVLPALGETAVVPATIGDLFPGVVADGTERPQTATVKGELVMVEVLTNAVAALQRAPRSDVEIVFNGTPLRLGRDQLRRARDRARATGLPHELARATCRDGVVDVVTDAWARAIGTDPYDGTSWLDDDDRAALRAEVEESEELDGLLDHMWPRLTPLALLRLLWSDAELLSTAAKDLLTPQQQALLRREADAPWTASDVALLDEAAELVGHDDTAQRSAEARARREQEAYARGVLEILHGSRALEDDDVADEIDWDDAARVGALEAAALADRFTEEDHRTLAERALADRDWVFDHVVVDEAQELTPMDWRLIVRRCPSRSMTVVGDLAQTSRQPEPRSWAEALEPALAGRWRLAELDVSYRTPKEVLDVAAQVLAGWRPDLRAPRALRRSGRPVQVWRAVDDAAASTSVAVASMLDDAGSGTTAVVAPRHRIADCRAATGERDVTVLTPREAKGLEFDQVVLVAPEDMTPADLYVALTRCTARLTVVTEAPELPWEGPRNVR